MARILILSSWVARGHVGLSAAVPVLNALGHSVTQLPTILLSNHPGWPHVAGEVVPPEMLRTMIDALTANGWLDGHDAVLTGYLPTVAHVTLAAELVTRLRGTTPVPRIVVDPIIGDAPGGLYLPEAVAEALRAELCPLADLLTPNRFELGWLTGRSVETLTDTDTAAEALRAQCCGDAVLATSAPLGPDRTGVLARDAAGTRVFSTTRLDGVPHGVGDVFSALMTAGLPTATALGHLQALVAESLGADHLRIVEAAGQWTTASPLHPTRYPGKG
ncbi:MAG: bifunctional hydroxymethylpyrimidine kinase/phosphomethylpyrimidine kinase [Rhodobacteraceae bacterium]|nr:bifunctional hydroxymethylpyrimidine kinase/phosphomethylpyrimidine kinase [Paracoccaceae bacterium]